MTFTTQRAGRALAAAAAAAILAGPGVARADFLTFWAAGKTDWVGGSGDVFTTFDSAFGYGAALGVEVVGIDLWGEALAMGSDQALFTVNLGFDLSFGDETRFTIGLFTGPMFFLFPEQPQQTLQFDADTRSALQSAGISAGDIDRIESKYNEVADEEEELSRLAAGWNLGRLQTTLEYKLAPVLYIGVEGMVGYHYILTGEEAAADAKSGVVDQVARDQGLDRDQAVAVKAAVGAEDVDADNLDGFNYQAGIFLRLEL